MMAQLVGYGGEEGVECVVYNVSYGVTQQLSQSPQQTREAFMVEHEPCYAEIDTAPAVNRKTAVVRKMSARDLQSPQQTGHETGETDTAEHEPFYAMIDTTPAADRETTVVRKMSARDLQYEQIQEIMYAAAVSQPEEDLPKMKEKCGDWCCSSAICIDKIDYKTPVFRRARAMGWKIYAQTLFPLMGNKFRNFLIYSQLITILMTLIFSIITFSKAEFDVLFLVVALIGSLLAAADATFNLLTSCHIFEYYCKNNKGRTERGIDQESGNPTTEEPRTSSEEAASTTFKQCRKYTNTAVNTVDVLRIIASEIVLYVLLMCSIYKFQTLFDTLSLVLLLISAASFLIYVYVVRMIIIIRAIVHSQRIGKPLPQNRDTSSVQFDHSMNRSAKGPQAYFIYHTIMQMLLQVVMVLAVAIQIWYDNQSGHKNDGISVSGPLWFMMVGGYLLPSCGYLTFFIVTYYWVQEFPIGLCIDMITVLQLSQGNTSANLQANATTYQEKMNKITMYFRISELRKQFKRAKNLPFLSKLLYPLFSPTMVLLCVIFTALHAATAIVILREGHAFAWIIMIIYACFSTIANEFTFTVALAWSSIVIAIATVLVVVFF